MAFFKNHPVIAYPFENFRDGLQFRAVKDIVLNVRLVKQIIAGIEYYDEYDMLEGERIEMVAEKLYWRIFNRRLLQILKMQIFCC